MVAGVAPGSGGGEPVSCRGQYRNTVDELRQAECHRLNADRPLDREVSTAELRSLLRREWRSLESRPTVASGGAVRANLALASAYVLRTLLTAIFDHSPDRATAQTRLPLWVEQVQASGLSCFDRFIKTLHHWRDGIRNFSRAGIPAVSSKGSTTNSSCSNAAASVWMIGRVVPSAMAGYRGSTTLGMNSIPLHLDLVATTGNLMEPLWTNHLYMPLS